MDYRRLIPNLCTSMNLVFGMFSLLATHQGELVWGSLFIFLALVADGMDGRIARFFGVSSEMGKEMDSLCDLVSFGVAPAFLAWVFALHAYNNLGIAIAVFFGVCAMWRLARFNVNADVVHGYFMGLAAPAAGNVIAMTTLFFVLTDFNPLDYDYAYAAAVIVDGWLMTSHVHYPNFKGDGAESIFLPTKVVSLVIFLGILYCGREALLPALGVAFFVTYAVLGIINSIFRSFAKVG